MGNVGIPRVVDRTSMLLVAMACTVGLVLAMLMGTVREAYAAPSLEAGSLANESSVAVQTQAAKNMKQRGVKFDLKAGKLKTTYMKLKGAGKVKYAVKVSKPKVVGAAVPGFKKATFKVTWKLETKLSNADAQKVLKQMKKGYSDWKEISAAVTSFVTDFYTGQNLFWSNDLGVTVKYKSSKIKTTNKFRSGGYWFTLLKNWTETYTVTYPDTYDGLCVGAGGMLTSWNWTDEAFDNHDYEEGPNYFKTSFYKKKVNRKNFHFMRIR